MNTHTAVGKRHGIAATEINKLIQLEKADFEYKEWLALKYAQDWVFLNGEEPAGDYIIDYKKIYTTKEQGYILKLLRIMRFFNYLNNIIFNKSWRSDLEGVSLQCSIEPNIRHMGKDK